jgi:hypothetical protein
MSLRSQRLLLVMWMSAMQGAGCDALWYHIENDCELLRTCSHFLNSGTGGGVPIACMPTEDGEPIDATCGVFASAAASPGGDGTKARPFASLQEAIDKAGSGRVYACAAQGAAFAEAVTIAEGGEVYGGFDCEAWTWSASARSAIEGPADRVALTVTDNAGGAKVKGFAIIAASATVAGGSSIGVAVADVEAELAQVDVTAGDAMDGAMGETPAEVPQAGASAPDTEQTRPSNACAATNLVIGGTAGVTTCEDGETRGGDGGTGGITATAEGNGQQGADGAPMPEPNPNNKGLGGIGQTDAAGECEPGTNGKSGDPGTAGAAGSDTTLTLAGIAGGDGGTGISGKRGQGGGGGGGAKAGLFCKPGADIVEGAGASGGGGGAGGCGGKGGGGGKAGGSSVGILSLGTKLVLTEVTVTVGKAGKGGEGVAGQLGADGGAGAVGGARSDLVGSKAGCDGGRGGSGGDGGPGAGGRGGHAVGIAYATAPNAAPAVQFTPGTPGNGGGAAPGGPPESAGAPGSAGLCWNFAAQSPCEGSTP